MVDGSTPDRQRVAVVTGGGAGIGAAIAAEIGRGGTYIVTLDPLVSLDGAERLPEPEETTAGRIVAAGGSARASSTSVTDRDGVRALFEQIADEFGGLDVVVNVAGITRPTSVARGSEDDWRRVLSVHLEGYRNVLDAALPLMAEAGRGHVLVVTSGSGWRSADTGAYGCAKRAVASLTWQLGAAAPPGVVVNAISPIAMTRMVAAALGRTKPSGRSGSGSSSTGGLSLGSMPAPEQLGPFAAHLVRDGFDACRGQVLFAAGSEVAVVGPPRLVEAISTDGPAPLARVLDAATAGAFIAAERDQMSGGGSNPRFVEAFDDGPATASPGVAAAPPSRGSSCLLVSDRPAVADAVIASLGARGVSCRRVAVEPSDAGFDAAAAALAASVAEHGRVDAVVVAMAGSAATSARASDWEEILGQHDGIVDEIRADAAWSRAVADHAATTGEQIRLVTLTDATDAGGRSRAQAAAQLARAASGATDGRVAAFALSIESVDPRVPATVGELTAHLLCSPDTTSLSGAELMVATGFVGLRSHPRVDASVVFGGTAVPSWFDDLIRGTVG